MNLVSNLVSVWNSQQAEKFINQLKRKKDLEKKQSLIESERNRLEVQPIQQIVWGEVLPRVNHPGRSGLDITV